MNLEQFEDDDYNRAIVEFNKSLQLRTEPFIALNARGMCWTMKDEHDKAIHDSDEAIWLEPNIAGFWQDRGDIEGAISDFDEAFLLDPEVQDTMDDRDDALSLRNRRLH